MSLLSSIVAVKLRSSRSSSRTTVEPPSTKIRSCSISTTWESSRWPTSILYEQVCGGVCEDLDVLPHLPSLQKHVSDATKTCAFQQFFLGNFYCDSDLLPAARKYWDHDISRLWGKSRLDGGKS
ncbi:hypothetical protein LINPERPRIM_LOCUS237 [Linum perenne]